MKSSTLQHRILRATLPGLSVLVVALGVIGCKKPPTGTAGGPSASSSAGTATASGPCASYSSKLCDKVGIESATCQAIKTATDLMPPDACAAGLKDVEYSVKKLATARKSCEELVDKLCTAVGKETQSCQLVTTETKKFPPDKCQSMMDHLPEVVAELKKMEQANQPLSAEVETAITQTGGVSFGPANAKVQVVEFSDFQCPYCSRAATVVHQIKEKYGDRVRFTFHQFPLSMHPNARVAAEAALAANSQGKFWEFHDLLFKNQQQLDRTNLEEHAKHTGLNLAVFKKSLDDHKLGPAVEADLKLGEQAAVQGTPSMFVNGTRVSNPTSFEAVAEMIETALKSPSPG